MTHGFFSGNGDRWDIQPAGDRLRDAAAGFGNAACYRGKRVALAGRFAAIREKFEFFGLDIVPLKPLTRYIARNRA